VRIVTWNLQGSKLRDLDGVAAKLVELDADVVCCQEIQRRQLRALRDHVGPYAEWALKHWPVRAPFEGLGVMARIPIVQARRFAITRTVPWWSWRRRIALSIVLGTEAGLVRIVNTHLGSGVPDRVRARQARRILERVGGVDIVAGDLNVTPESHVLAEFEPCVEAWERRHPGSPHPNTNWGHGPRAHPPIQRLDFVLVGPDLEVVDVQIPRRWETWAPLSDHLPVVVDLDLGPAVTEAE
jgi:endonuclease/exonuclease/phosphatase family metal-dependent hydrolase